MGIIADIHQGLLAEFIWSITWGLYQLPLETLLMILFLRFSVKMRMQQAIMWSIGASLFTALVFTLYVAGFLIYVLNLATNWVADPLAASMYLGIIYGVLQSAFFWILRVWHPIDLRMITICITLSNVCAALIIYKLTLTGLTM